MSSILYTGHHQLGRHLAINPVYVLTVDGLNMEEKDFNLWLMQAPAETAFSVIDII